MEFPLVLASLRQLLNYLKSHFKLAFRGVTSTLLSADDEGREETRKTLYIYVYDNVCCRCSYEARRLCVLELHFLFNFLFAAAVKMCIELLQSFYVFISATLNMTVFKIFCWRWWRKRKWMEENKKNVGTNFWLKIIKIETEQSFCRFYSFIFGDFA